MWQKIKLKLKQWRGNLIIVPCVAGFIIVVSNTGIFRLLEWAVLDQFFRLNSSESIDEQPQRGTLAKGTREF